jgi:hypothetical protein
VNVIVSAVVGGTISKVTGGKFANGAQTWAFSAAMAQDWGNAKSQSNGGSCSRCGVTTLGNIDDLSYDQLADLRSGLYDARADGYDSVSIDSAIGSINSKISSTLGVQAFDPNQILLGVMVRNYRDTQTAVAQAFYQTAEFAAIGAFSLELLGATAGRLAFMSATERSATFGLFGESLSFTTGVDGSAAYILQQSRFLTPHMRVMPSVGKVRLRVGSDGRYIVE